MATLSSSQSLLRKVDPVGVVVALADIDVDTERDDRTQAMPPSVRCCAFELRQQALLIADFSAAILSARRIEPVLSSTSATRRRDEPQAAVDEAFTLIFW